MGQYLRYSTITTKGVTIILKIKIEQECSTYDLYFRDQYFLFGAYMSPLSNVTLLYLVLNPPDSRTRPRPSDLERRAVHFKEQAVEEVDTEYILQRLAQVCTWLLY